MRPRMGRTLCEMHYMRHWRAGTLAQFRSIQDDWGDRFLRSFSKLGSEDCWEWQATIVGGYGRMTIAGISWGAHQLSYVLHHADLPDGAVIRHRCDNPPCVNPAHLEPGTVADNNHDRTVRGRSASRVTAAGVREIRDIYSAGGASLATLGRKFGIGRTTVHQIIHRDTWAHVA